MLSTCALHLARASSSALPCAPVLGAVAARYVLQRPAWATRMASGLASGLSGLSIMRRNVAALAAEQQADHSDNDDPQLQQQQPPLQQQQQVLLESGGGCAGCDALTAPLPSALLAAVGSRPHHHHHASEDEVTPIPAVSGRIHSVESFSAVDGPGVRMVVFEQGCGMRCSFCSNPDTWSKHIGGEEISSKEIAQQLRSVAPYLRPGGGGVTCSGGEALLQPQFTAAVFQEAHALSLTTCLDTTGQGTKHAHWDVVLPHTDMVLFCIKHLNPAKYAGLTGVQQGGALRFAAELKARGIPHWLRYVLIPGFTDDEDGLARLVDFCHGQQPALQGVELLPYHRLGVNKWQELGVPYPLDGVETPPTDKVLEVVSRLEAAGLCVICDAKRQHKAGDL